MTTQLGTKLELTELSGGSGQAVTPPSKFSKIVLGHVENPSGNGAVYLRGVNQDDAVLFQIRVGAGFSGPVLLDLVVGSGSLEMTASTSDDGTGAPSATVAFTPMWEDK